MAKLKKMMALAIAMVMVICTMNMGIFAATGDLAVDTKITITDLTAGDTVNLFKVLEWTDSVGWTVTSDFKSLTENPSDQDKYSENVAKLVANTKGIELNAADLAKIATAAQGKTPVHQEIISGTTFTYQTTDKPGMYIALVAAGTAGTVYNPIVISADFTADNNTNSIPASSAINGTAVAKKKVISGDKTEPKITNDLGKSFAYTVTTTIPVYSEAFTDTFFQITDTVSEYLDIQNDIKVVDTDTNSEINVQKYLTQHPHDFTIRFDHDYVKNLQAAQNIKITYTAKLNVPASELVDPENVIEEENEIVIIFPNDPNDLSGKKVTALKDGTREYTFTIDGKLFGRSDWDTAELVKTGVDQNGDPVEKVIPVSNGSEFAALAGAKFGLFTTETGAKAALKDPTSTTDLYKNYDADGNVLFDGYVTTSALGLMTIAGLDQGTYYLVELDAPSGYIKDSELHTITITADINGDEENEEGQAVTEYYTVDNAGNVTWHDTKVDGSIAYTYYVPVLRSYTVTIDGKNTSTYTMTLDGPSISSVTPAESSTDIKNTKGVELPATGGIGTTIFYVIGTVLVLGAGILLVTRRRMNME